MNNQVINYPGSRKICGFTNVQFRKLDGIFCRTASLGILNFRTVDCDFEKGVASFTFSKSEWHRPYISFIIRRQGGGSRKVMYELYKERSGCIMKSGLFERAFDRLNSEIRALESGEQ